MIHRIQAFNTATGFWEFYRPDSPLERDQTIQRLRAAGCYTNINLDGRVL